MGEQLLPTTQPVLARAIEPLERGSQGHACPHPVLGDSSSEAPVCPPPLWAGCAYRPPPSGLLAALHLTWVTSTPFPREPLVSPERIDLSGPGGDGRPSAGSRKVNTVIYHPCLSSFSLSASVHPLCLPHSSPFFPPSFCLVLSARPQSGHRAVAVNKAELLPLEVYVFMGRGTNSNPGAKYISYQSGGGKGCEE